MLEQIINNDFAEIDGIIYASPVSARRLAEIQSRDYRQPLQDRANAGLPGFYPLCRTEHAEIKSIQTFLDTKKEVQYRLEYQTKNKIEYILPSYTIACKGERFLKNIARIKGKIFVLRKHNQCDNPAHNLKPKYNLFIEQALHLDEKEYYFSECNTSPLSLKLKLERHIISISCRIKTILSRGFYDEKENIGAALFGSKFYAYSIQQPYALYEQRNKKHYTFGEAVVGVEISVSDGSIVLHNPVVINKYTHPALKRKNFPFQQICFEKPCEVYENKYIEIKRMLHKAKEALTRGYQSQLNAWHPLTDSFYFTPCAALRDVEVTNI